MGKQVVELNGRKVWATQKEIETITVLCNTRLGGAASVRGYRPSSNWVVSPVQNIQFLSRISTQKLYQRRLEALDSLTYSDVAGHIADDPKLATMTHNDLLALFESRREMERNSIQKTLDNDRSDAHRQGHDRCYIHVDQGVKVHLVTEKGKDGLMHPVMHGGKYKYPIVDSIMISALFLKVTTLIEGQRKVVNSGEPVRMGNIIQKALNKPGLTLRKLSLKPDNFDAVCIDHAAITSTELHSLAA